MWRRKGTLGYRAEREACGLWGLGGGGEGGRGWGRRGGKGMLLRMLRGAGEGARVCGRGTFPADSPPHYRLNKRE